MQEKKLYSKSALKSGIRRGRDLWRGTAFEGGSSLGEKSSWESDTANIAKGLLNPSYGLGFGLDAFGFSKSDKRRQRERATDDYIRLKRGDINRFGNSIWEYVSKGQLDPTDFNELFLSEQTGDTTGLSSGHYGNLGGTFGSQFFLGGANESIKRNYERMLGIQQTQKRKKDESMLTPGAYKQTRGGLLDGMFRNKAKATLMGKY